VRVKSDKPLDRQADDADQAKRAYRDRRQATSWLAQAEAALKKPRSPLQVAASQKNVLVARDAAREAALAKQAKRERGIMSPSDNRRGVIGPTSAPTFDHTAHPTRNAEVAINLRAVAEVCLAAGLNPAERIVEALNGNELDAGLKARVNLELLSYLQPKLKAVEVRVEDNRDLSEEQIDERIDSLLAKLEARKRG
jgi:hypothetical protein